MKIIMRLADSGNGTGAFWTPFDRWGSYDIDALEIVSSLGYAPDTNAIADGKIFPGWNNPETIGRIVSGVTDLGCTIEFLAQSPD